MEMKQWKQLRLLKHFLIWTPLILCWMKKEWVSIFIKIQSVLARFICERRRDSIQRGCMELVLFFNNFQIAFMYIVWVSEIQCCMQWKISLPCQSWTGKDKVKNYREKMCMKLDGLDCSILFVDVYIVRIKEYTLTFKYCLKYICVMSRLLCFLWGGFCH